MKDRKQLPAFLKLSYTFDMDKILDEFKKFEGDKKWNPYENGLPKNIEKKLTKRYQDVHLTLVSSRPQ